jgi:hypothetical protein
MAVDQKILDKLQKLLALSASGNEHEAALALGKAQDLMNEHNLTVQDVAVDGSGADITSHEMWGLTKSRQKWEASLSASVADAFDGRAVVDSDADGWFVTFVAGKTDMVIIVDLFERLRLAVRRLSKLYVDRERSMKPWLSGKTLHNSYRRGMVQTIHKRLAVLKQNTRPNDRARNQHGLSGMDLVVVKKSAVDQRISELFGQTRKEPRRRIKVDRSAYQQGREDGNSVSLHQALDGKPAGFLTS